MDDSEDVAPEVRSILAAAGERPAPGGRVDVDSRGFAAALAAVPSDRRPVIAEVKPTSPTTEGRRDDDPVDLAREMVAGGAAALSVLTEPDHFGGSTDRLRRVREAVDVPVLRKDFLLEADQLDAVAADAVLLIARFLDDLPGTVAAARDRGMEPLVEVHTEAELDRALAADATLVGVNNRDLARLAVDLATFERVAPAAPDDVTLVAESGIASPDDADRMLAAGADGLLVGTAIMDGDVRANAERLTARGTEVRR
jgi:indole-3-glycerol phosphate synthase